VELIETRVEPAGDDRVRLAGQVRYADSRTETIWFEVPAALEPDLTTTGHPWIVALLPLAARLGEDLRIPLPVDRLLVRNLTELLRIWRGWYPTLREVPLDVTICESPATRRAGAPARTAAFFSGGVDSFYTLLRHAAGGVGRLIVDELIAVDQAIVASIPPETMATSLGFMLPAMNIDDRAELLGAWDDLPASDADAGA